MRPKAPPSEERPEAAEDIPRDEAELKAWVERRYGITIADAPVCDGHVSPWEFFSRIYLDRPPLALVLGPRGGGKSFLSALNTHLTSRSQPRHGTRILGGSKSQSEQVYEALRELAETGPVEDDPDEGLEKMTKDEAIYENGSRVKILAASRTSVRGPHVPTLMLDEVDEIDPEIRESAMGMCMNKRGQAASVVMTSTWHRPDGPMSALMERANSGEFPLYTFCAFEVLERCPDERSGPDLENCPECPLRRWCHADLGKGRGPKAKRANGHYAIDALIQKVRSIGRRTFEADYLCLGPKADGLWFPAFDEARHVSAEAEYDPTLPVYAAIDSGVYTGAVAFQMTHRPGPHGPVEEVRVFADYLSEGLSAERNSLNLLDWLRRHCNGRYDALYTDPAGASRNAIGPTVVAEYERVGLRPLQHWPKPRRVRDALAILESFVEPADGRSRLVVHPRCEQLIAAFKCYRRAQRNHQWTGDPQDPQHPAEDLIDALRGGLHARFPDGRAPKPLYARALASKVF